ncbi:hypothetical protein M196_gp24 [Halorubrum tailed virus 4]|uniref:Uncharacterized protein n=1 Tax=Halorubrum tailed virus 4 TaxID=1273752 RepID=R4TLT5_9CAUD|nr:hypothetical protein M196_gp24 [Halorubrum tailed virus 4]AGM11118.1 hypothetical protein HRTV4_24 [Halorubrum tailed virus 4]
MTKTCDTDGCDKTAEMYKDYCPLCQFRAKDGDTDLTGLNERVNR